MEDGLGPLHIAGQVDLGPRGLGPGAHLVAGSKPWYLQCSIFPQLEFCAFPIGKNIVVLNVECGELNAPRRCYHGFKACGKHTLPNIYTTHFSLMTHLMHLLSPYPYK